MKLKDKINKVIDDMTSGTLIVNVGKKRIKGKTYYLFQDMQDTEYYNYYQYVSAQEILERTKKI